MNIVVLAGGLSTERDVSFVTGNMVSKALREAGHQVILLDVFMGYGEEEVNLDGIFEKSEEISVKVDAISTKTPDLKTVKASRKDQSDCFFGPNVIAMCRMADIVFMALHGANGEDGRIQAAFDLFGIKYTGSGYLSSAICMDKGTTKIFLKAAGVPVPEGIVVTDPSDAKEKITEQVAYPLVVKPLCGGSSVGVSIVRGEEQLEEALLEAFRWESQLVVEEYVEGREFSVGVIDGHVLPIIEIAPIEGFYDYKNKYQAGSTIETCPAMLSDEQTKQMQRYAKEAADALGLTSYARIDFLMKEDGSMYCLEANTLPGMTPTSLLPQEAAAEGVSFTQLCEKLIQLSL